MASFVGAITEFNPYIQQIPTEAYTKVGMFKEQQYEAGVAKVQDSVDKIIGLDIANESGRQYLRARVDELTGALNKYSSVDFSNPTNISQLTGLAKPLYQDENIVNDVINTNIYRKWSKDAGDAYKAGKMELGQYMRESTDANKWLNSPNAGTPYTGRQQPNTATKKELLDRVIKAKKDGMEKSEFVYDSAQSPDRAYYIKSTNKYYNEAEFNNFIAENIMSNRDREMLMNDHWYENQGKPVEQLQREDLLMYTGKIDQNNRQIESIINDPKIYAGDKRVEAQQTIDELTNYNKQLRDGKIDYLKNLNLADPTSRDIFHRDLSEARFVGSLDILRDQVRKEELVKNDQWFSLLAAQVELAKEVAKAKTAEEGKKKTPLELTDEVAVFDPVDPNAPKTELSLNTVKTGYEVKNDQINQSMNSLIGKLMENGVDMRQFMQTDASGSLVWDQVNVGNKGGASMNVPVFKDSETKNKFYSMVAGLNYAYNKEAEDGKLDNKDFTQYVKTNILNYNDDDPNSKFTLADKVVSDALNTLKGTSALLPRLDKLFSDKGVVRTLSSMDGAIKDKRDMANSYREALLKSNALTTDEANLVRNLPEEQLMSGQTIIDLNSIQSRATKNGDYNESGKLSVIEQSDGSYAIGEKFLPVVNGKAIDTEDRAWYQKSGQELSGNIDIPKSRNGKTYLGGFKTKKEAEDALSSATTKNGVKIINAIPGLSDESLRKADQFVKNTYSYVQESVSSSVVNLKQDKPAYAAITDGLTLFVNRAKVQASPEDITIENGTVDPRSLTGISKVDILGATVSNTQDIFNPNPMYDIQFEAVTGQGTKEEKKTLYTGQVSLKSFLATNPNYRTTEYAKYFAPAVYAQKDAYARIHSNINPLEGSQASYANRDDIAPVYQSKTQSGQNSFNSDADTGFQWETLPIEKDGKQTMVSYQVISLGQNTVLGNAKNKDGNNYAPGSFYIKMKVPTSTGKPKEIFLKSPTGESIQFQNASNAHYAMRDLIFNNPAVAMDEIDQKTGLPNYFSTDPNTIRGIFNTQLSYNGFSKLDAVKMKDAVGVETTKYQANQLQFGGR